MHLSIITLAAIFAAPMALANPVSSTPIEFDPEFFTSAFKIEGPAPPLPDSFEAGDISVEKLANGNVYMCQA